MKIDLTLTASGCPVVRAVTVDKAVIAGWTGRDAAALELHITELEALGIPRPKSTPVFYRVSKDLITTAGAIQVCGATSSGEVEPVILVLDDGLWIGLGSDHTDRQLEAVGIALSKQVCAKPIGDVFWKFEEIEAHWDDVQVSSSIDHGGALTPYQSGAVASMRHPRELMRLYAEEIGLPIDQALPAGTMMFCGTLAVHGHIRTDATRFRMKLSDPVLAREIEHSYVINDLQVAS